MTLPRIITLLNYSKCNVTQLVNADLLHWACLTDKNLQWYITHVAIKSKWYQTVIVIAAIIVDVTGKVIADLVVTVRRQRSWERHRNSIVCSSVCTPDTHSHPSAIKGSGVVSSPGWSVVSTSPISALTSVIFLWSFSNVARTFIALRYRTSWITEVLPR